jgi:hypothetical protein
MEPVTQSPPAEQKPKLLDQVRDAIRVKHYSTKTEEAYRSSVSEKYFIWSIIICTI